ncbi:MAG: hypothetical protein QOF76_431, partial [Solirubrobacteraceae bacterium]|nr:hypothetical protein [Solirubrobacteraceae bacterium]
MRAGTRAGVLVVLVSMVLAVAPGAAQALTTCSVSAAGVATVTSTSQNDAYVELTATKLQYRQNSGVPTYTDCGLRSALEQIIVNGPQPNSFVTHLDLTTDLSGGSAEADGTPEIEVDTNAGSVHLGYVSGTGGPPPDAVVGMLGDATMEINTDPHAAGDADADIHAGACAVLNCVEVVGRTDTANRFSSAGGSFTGSPLHDVLLEGGDLADQIALGNAGTLVFAHDGDDTITGAQNNVRDIIDCGPGTDTGTADGNEFSLDNCEFAPPVTWSIGGFGAAQPFDEGTVATFPVKLSAALPFDASVVVSTQDGPNPSATAGSDYTAKTQTITIPAGQTTASFTVQTTQDQVDEARENVQAVLSSPSAAAGLSSTTVGTDQIADDDPLPNASISSATVAEGGTATLTITLDRDWQNPTAKTILVSTATGTAGAGDFTGLTNKVVSFTGGAKTATVDIATTDDTLDEPDQSFTVSLIDTTSLDVGVPASGTVTITDNDPQPTLTVTAATPVVEGASATLTLAPSGGWDGANRTVRVTVGGTAVAAGDTGPRTVTFTGAGAQQTVTVPTINDDIDAPDRTVTFAVDMLSGLSLPGGVNGVNRTVTVTDNDAKPTVSIGAATAVEGSTLKIPVSLQRRSASAIKLNVAATPGTAGAGDF